MVSRDKEQLIRKLLKQNWHWGRICDEVHCSPNTIQKVKEKKSEQIRSRKIKSNRTEALRMYDKGYAPLAVAVKLDISADEAESYKIEYWRLNHMNEFEQIYKANKDSLPLIISKFRELQAHNISLDRLTQAITLVTSMPQLLNERQRLNNEIQVVNADYKQRQAALWNIQSEIRLKETDLRNTVLENNRIEHIKNMNYKELFETVSNIIREILGDKNTILNAGLLAIIRAIGKYPDHKTVLMNHSALDSSISSYILNDSNQSIGADLVAEANIFYDDILGELVEKVIKTG